MLSVWDDAPPDSVLINASRAGFKGSYQNRVSPGAEVVLTLKRSLSLSGRIRDAKTDKAIDDASVEFGTPDPKSGAIIWAQNSAVFAGAVLWLCLENDRTGPVTEENARGAIAPIENRRRGFGADDKRASREVVLEIAVGGRDGIDEARTDGLDVEGEAVVVTAR